MGTEDGVKTKLARVGTGRQARTTTGPSVAGRDAARGAPAEPSEFIKAREAIRRPPLPEPGLYEAYLVKQQPPIPIRRPAETATETQATIGEPGEPVQQARADALKVSSADAWAALEAWSTLSPRHKPKTDAS